MYTVYFVNKTKAKTKIAKVDTEEAARISIIEFLQRYNIKYKRFYTYCKDGNTYVKVDERAEYFVYDQV